VSTLNDHQKPCIATDPKIAENIWILEDAMSPVPAPPLSPLPDHLNFPKIADEAVAAWKAAGMKVRSATVLRALIHLATPAEMIAHAVRLAGDSALGVVPPEEEIIAGHPTVDLPEDDVKKLDGVAENLQTVSLFFEPLASPAWVLGGKYVALGMRHQPEDPAADVAQAGNITFGTGGIRGK